MSTLATTSLEAAGSVKAYNFPPIVEHDPAHDPFELKLEEDGMRYAEKAKILGLKNSQS